MGHAENWRERVDDVLWIELGVCALRTDSPASSGFLGPGPQTPPTGIEPIDAFEAIGLLDAEEAAVWRERFVAPDRPRDSISVSREHLHAYLARLMRASRQPPGDGENEGDWLRPQIVLNDLHRIGLIDEAELHWWFSLLSPSEPDGSAGPLHGPRPGARLDRLVRCVPGPSERRRGLRVLAADIFEDGVCIHLHHARRGRDADGAVRPLPDELEPDAPRLPSTFQVTLADDVGTSYVGLGGGGGGSGHADGPLVHEQTQAFAMTVPARATRLVVVVDEVTFEVAL